MNKLNNGDLRLDHRISMKRIHFQRNKKNNLILPIKPKLKNLIKPKIYTQHNKLKDSLIDKDNVKKDNK